MRLLVDANISPHVVSFLRARRHDVLFVQEWSPHADDRTILRRAVRDRRVVITYDKDFGELVFHEGEQYHGVVLVRVQRETSRDVIALLDDFFDSYSSRAIHSSFFVVTDKRTRRVMRE